MFFRFLRSQKYSRNFFFAFHYWMIANTHQRCLSSYRHTSRVWSIIIARVGESSSLLYKDVAPSLSRLWSIGRFKSAIDFALHPNVDMSELNTRHTWSGKTKLRWRQQIDEFILFFSLFSLFMPPKEKKMLFRKNSIDFVYFPNTHESKPANKLEALKIV